MRSEDRVALVTGAGSGIGRAIALALAQEGAHVVVNDALGDRADATVAEIRTLGGRSLSAAGDVASEAAVHDVVEKVVATFGRVELLVNNAGIPDQFVATTEQRADRLQRVVDVKGIAAAGVPFGFPDDVDVGPDGTVYFTAASSKFRMHHDREDILEHGGHGRLLAYHPSTGRTELLLSGLQFANASRSRGTGPACS